MSRDGSKRVIADCGKSCRRRSDIIRSRPEAEAGAGASIDATEAAENGNAHGSLEDMTLEELWELFPITLSSHNPEWKEWADSEIKGLHAILKTFSPDINHIGSTAIPGIKAKPVVDILVEIPDDRRLPAVKEVLEGSGYICMSAAESRMSFNKGYTPDGYADKVFHIHVHRSGDNDEIRFRDYLIANPDMAKEYEALKLSLLPRYRNDRDAYTEAKSEFVGRINTLAE